MIRRPRFGSPSLPGAESEDRTPRDAFETIHLRPGLEMGINSNNHPGGLKIGFEIEKPPLTLSYNLSLPVRCSMVQGVRHKLVLERCVGDSLLAYLPQTKGLTEIPPGCLNGISVSLSPEILGEYFNSIPEFLREIISPRFTAAQGKPFYHRAMIGWDTYLVLQQILECPYEGDTRRIFLEAKALELLCHKLAEMGREHDPGGTDISRKELDLAREAHHILLNRLDQPPSLHELGIMVGLNRNKLNQSFKRLYGDTVFRVLQKARLSKARIMLGDPDYSLAEIALAVGYSDQANFSNAFRRHYGQTPRTARQELTGVAVSPMAGAETVVPLRP